MSDKKKIIIFLVGPTAIGKTEIAVNLAKKINAEIVSLDSMQIYKGMDIITSKPSLSLRKKVPHYLIDVISPTREYNVSKYRKVALKKIDEIIKRGKIPVFVGGSGLYMSILIDGIFKERFQNRNLRLRLYQQARQHGNEFLYERLRWIDAEASIKIHLHDTKRIIRALEVFENTGKPISILQKQKKALTNNYDVKIFCLNMEREKLYKKIEERIDMMFDNGLVDEARRLLGLNLSKTALCALGIKELKGYFEGLYDIKEAKILLKKNTRRYAKRQLTWFRKDKRINWININDKDKPYRIAQRIWKKLF